MPIAWSLFRYLSVKTLIGVGVFFGALSALVILIDMVERLRIVGQMGTEAGFSEAFVITLLRAPNLTEALLPFVFLFGAMWTFSQLNRRSELVVMRAAGLSAWRIIGPSLIVAAIVGGVTIFAYNPLSARLMAQAERFSIAISGKGPSFVNFSSGGFWLRQSEDSGHAIIRASGYEDEGAGANLKNVTVWRMNSENEISSRIDAASARLEANRLKMREAVFSLPGEAASFRETFEIATPFSRQQLRESAAPPDTMSIWELPQFINVAREAGFPVVRYEQHWHRLISLPAKLCAMVLIAAAFSMRQMRGGGTAQLVVFGIGAGFALFVLSDLTDALGESGLIPVSLAAWAPTLAAALFASTLILHLEDG
ncbi:MAG: LPS export ABC transporter permease LptG [Pseudomonadota bacterium]